MRQALIFTGLGLVAGIGVAALFAGSPLPGLGPPSQVERPALGADGPLDARIVALESALAEEARQRVLLESDLELLADQLAAFNGIAGKTETETETESATAMAAAGEADEALPPVAARTTGRRDRASPEYRLTQLVEAGFAQDQAQWIIDREAQMRMDVLNAQYEARRQGEAFNPLEGQLASQNQMRVQLGDDGYARYLEATGRPTSVGVREVLASSPGQAAGLQRGDEIVSYAGQRIFSVAELNELTIDGQPGETIAVDILRDGQPMQIYLPRGPIGFTSGGRGFAFGPGGDLP